MKKSRTLKDIQKCSDCGNPNDNECPNLFALQEEAIKWIMNCCPKKTPKSIGSPLKRCSACERFIEFFNLEDLK